MKLNTTDRSMMDVSDQSATRNTLIIVLRVPGSWEAIVFVAVLRPR